MVIAPEPDETRGELRLRWKRSRATRSLALVQPSATEGTLLAGVAGLAFPGPDVRTLSEPVNSREAALNAVRSFLAERSLNA